MSVFGSGQGRRHQEAGRRGSTAKGCARTASGAWLQICPLGFAHLAAEIEGESALRVLPPRPLVAVQAGAGLLALTA